MEGFKKNKNAIELIQGLRNISTKRIYINEIVCSETIYQLTVKKYFKKEEVFSFLSKFNFLDIKLGTIKLAEKFILKYDLKPNDALILASCIFYNIPYLVSLDNDFKEPSEKEKIILVNNSLILNS